VTYTPAFYHADGNGNVTYLLKLDQTAGASYQFDPYGRLLASSGTLAAANTYRFSSKEVMLASGFYSFGYRFYDPATQRWLNRDPIQENGGLNLYGYVCNNPVELWDPTGRTAVGAAIGRAIGVGLGAWTGGIIGGAGGAAGGTLVAPGVGTIVGGEFGAVEGAVAGGIVGGGFGAWAGDVISDIYNSVRNPGTGTPGSEETCNRPDGKKKQTRRYGPDGYPEKDTDFDHDHGQGQPHVHEWDRPSDGSPPRDGNRGPGRPPKPGDPGIPSPPAS